MSNLDILYLSKFYDLLYENLKSTKKIEEDSVLLTFIKTRKNTIYKIIKQSMINGHNIPRNMLQSLLDKEYIKPYEKFNSFIITSKGVWIMEKNRNVLDETILLSFLNNEYFSKTVKDENLNDKEKVILFAMILGRSFSKESAVSLKYSDSIIDKWLEILEKSYSLLKDINIITYKKERVFTGTKNVDIVSSMFRHNNDMMEKTLGIYNFTRNQEYFFNVLKNNYFDDEKLSYLFYKLFQGKLNSDQIKTINELCNNVSRNYSIFLYDVASHVFALPEYDLKIKDCLFQSLILYR